jgi:hypothetical protein
MLETDPRFLDMPEISLQLKREEDRLWDQVGYLRSKKVEPSTLDDVLAGGGASFDEELEELNRRDAEAGRQTAIVTPEETEPVIEFRNG